MQSPPGTSFVSFQTMIRCFLILIQHLSRAMFPKIKEIKEHSDGKRQMYSHCLTSVDPLYCSVFRSQRVNFSSRCGIVMKHVAVGRTGRKSWVIIMQTRRRMGGCGLLLSYSRGSVTFGAASGVTSLLSHISLRGCKVTCLATDIFMCVCASGRTLGSMGFIDSTVTSTLSLPAFLPLYSVPICVYLCFF